MRTIKEKIMELVSVLQALTMQRVNAVQQGKQAEAMQIQAVQEDIDNKIQELELFLEFGKEK
jgi:hypothetical protein